MSRRAANIAARDLFTDKLKGLYSPHDNAPTYDDCVTLHNMILAERGFDDATAMLNRFGCRRMADLKDVPGLYDEFYRYGTTALLRGVSPTYAWSTLNGAPNHLRDRWLLWHGESDCWWEVRGKLGPADLNALASGEVLDVSGVTKHEEEFKRQQAGGFVSGVGEDDEL